MSNQENKFFIKVPKVLRNIVNKYIVFQDFVFDDENLDSIMEYYDTFEPVLDDLFIYGKFGPVCSGGNLKTFQFLHSLLTTPDVYSRRIMLRVFENICQNGHLNIAEWFITKYKINYIYAEKDEIFRVVCKNGHLEMAEFLYNLFGMNEQYNSTRYMHYFKLICTNDHLDMAKWFVEILHYEGFKESKTFEAVCQRGHLEMAKWLKDAFEIDKTDIKKSLTETFEVLCGDNRISMLTWLTETFKITNQDISNLNNIFATACSLGKIEIVQYLDTTFTIKINRLSSIPGNVFESVCKKGDLKMAEFVKEKFNIVSTSFRLLYIFEQICNNGNFEMVKWLEEQFRVSSIMSRPSYYFTFSSICNRNDLNFEKWFFEKFESDPGNYSDYSILFGQICKKEYFEMAKWLYNRTIHNGTIISSKNFDVVDTFEVLVKKGNVDMARWLAVTFEIKYSQSQKYQCISRLILQNKLKLCKWLLSEPKFTEAQSEDISKKEYKKLGILDEYKLTIGDKSDLFMYAFEKADGLLAKFFIKEFRLTTQNTIFKVEQLLITQLKNGRLKNAKFLLVEFGFNRENFLLYFKNTMIECCTVGGDKIFTWLVDNLQLTKEDLMFDDNVLINTAVRYNQTVIISYLNQLGIEQDVQ